MVRNDTGLAVRDDTNPALNYSLSEASNSTETRVPQVQRRVVCAAGDRGRLELSIFTSDPMAPRAAAGAFSFERGLVRGIVRVLRRHQRADVTVRVRVGPRRAIEAGPFGPDKVLLLIQRRGTRAARLTTRAGILIDRALVPSAITVLEAM